MAADACETPSTDARAADAQRSPTASTDVRSQSSPARGHLSPTADQPEAQSPRYAAKPQSPQAKKEWLNSLNSQVSGGRALRASLRTAASSRLPKAKGMDLKLLGSVERALEDKLKVRSATEKTLMATLARREHYMNQTGYRVEQCLLALRKTGGEAWCHLNMTEKRLELRGQMPEQEQLQDELQEALEQEKVDLQKVHKKLASKMAEADKCWNLVLSSKEEMLRRRLTLPYIRSSEPFEFLDMMKAREDELEAKCVVFESFLRDMEGAMSRFGRKTGAATRTVLSRLVDARRTLEVEIHMNRASVAAAEHRLNKLRKRIRRYYSMPENSELVEGDDNFSHCMDSLSKVLEQEDALFSPES